MKRRNQANTLYLAIRLYVINLPNSPSLEHRSLYSNSNNAL